MVARILIRLIALAICVCYLMIWILTRTKVYEDSWWSVIMENTSTVYFGIHGISILIYTVPILFVAVLGCLYLHLSQNLNATISQQQDKRNHWWKRLCFVKGPLGIISRTELAFLIIFIILLVFTFSNFLHIGTKSNPILSPQHVKRSLKFLDSAALWAGLIGNICLAFMFYPVTRNSSILPLFELSSESSVRYHKLLGNAAMTFFTIHGVLYILYWALTGNLKQMLKWEQRGISYLAGEVTLVLGILIWLTTYPKIRKNMFELFYYTHHLYIFFIIFFMLHTRLYDTFMMLPGFYLFVIDRYLRLLQSQQHVKLISARVLPCRFVELNFAKSPDLKYPPTSSMFINVPNVSRLQWHPFTVCSNSDLEQDTISVLIKAEGNWSHKLHRILSTFDPSIDHHHLPISVEGPYGHSSTNFHTHETLIMVSGGSGITPFISIIRGFIHASSKAHKTPRVVLISAFKYSAELAILDVLIPMSVSSILLSNVDVHIEAYITREQQHSSKSSNVTSKICFKAMESDEPVSSALGSNSWLWLSSIISVSFIISMVMIAVLTKYFLHPIEKNPKRLYARSLKTVFYILSFCFSIVVTASFGFKWNKRHNVKKVSQKENNIVPSVTDLEIESLQGNSIARVTNVHYGARPDLRKILNDYIGGGSTGVLVCGPKSMRNDIASICLMGNIHYESINFSW